MTAAQQEALKWLAERGGDGVFLRGNIVLCAGETAPHTAGTWKRLAEAGKVERYSFGKSRRIRIVEKAA